MILLIDNYDSFTYNLAQALGTLGAAPEVVRNDRLTLQKIETLAPERILISPGPKTPREAGISVKLVKKFAGSVPILGICLGHQCIAAAFGAKVVRAKRIMHGKTSPITHDGAGVFRGLPNPLVAMRYHSLIVDETTLPTELVATAHADQGELMGIRHATHALEGVQFHPESYRTDEGLALLKNFLAL